MNIFLHTNNKDCASRLSDLLEIDDNFEVTSYPQNIYKRKYYDLHVVDMDSCSFDILSTLQQSTVEAKVLCICSTCTNKTFNIATMFRHFDYIKKPLSREELAFKILQFSPQKKDLNLKQLDNKCIRKQLTEKETLFLNLLLYKIDIPISFNEIETSVYKSTDMTMDALRGMVKRLRTKLICYEIITLKGYGYLLEEKNALPH